MKKVISILVVVVMLAISIAGCGSTAPTATASDTQAAVTTAAAAPADTKAPASKELNIWSFTDELKTMAIAFEGKHPEIKVNYTMVPMTNGEFQTKVKAAVSSGDVPDAIALEASFVRQYVESDFLADLGDLLPAAKDLQTYQMTIDVGTYKGVTKAFSYQATPGALFYRRSLAKQYFGTDDPAAMQAIVADMGKFQDAAKVVKEKSNGNTFMVGSSGDFTNLFYANRKAPWVVDGKLTIDPMIDKMLDTAKAFRTNGYEAQAQQWQEGWFAGMNDSLRDAKGNPKQVFCYFLPTWGLPYVLMPNSAPKEDAKDKTKKVGKDTTGDWACINGPMPYQWGGTWAGAMKDAKNLDNAKAFVKFVGLDEQNLKDWALGTYTNDYLKKIDPSAGDKLSQGAGDFVSSKKVVDEITAQFDSAATSKFLAGENSYKGFAAAAPNVDLKLMQGTDDAIQRAFNDPINNYCAGKATKDEALKQFKDSVKNALPDIAVN